MDKKETMEKGAELETELGDGDATVLGDGEKDVAT